MTIAGDGGVGICDETVVVGYDLSINTCFYFKSSSMCGGTLGNRSECIAQV